MFLLVGTAAFFFSRAVWIANRRYFSTLRILGASRLAVAFAFSAFFVVAALIAATAACFAVGIGISEIRLPEAFGSTVAFSGENVFRLLLALPFALVPAIVPGVVSVFRTAPLSGLSEPKIALPDFWETGFSVSAAFVGLASFYAIVADSPLPDALRKAFFVLAAIATVLIATFFALRLSAKFFLSRKTKDFALFDAVRLSVAPGSPAFPVVSAFVIPAVLLASFSSVAFHFSSELARLSASGADVFAVNLLPDDVPSIRAEFPDAGTFSILRARIVRINGKTLRDHLGGEPSREFSREFNLTSSELPERIVRGTDRELRIGETSLDDEFAASLGIGVGDRITFSVMGREFELSAVNVRESSREGIRPFFYFQVAPGEFSGVPVSYFVSAETPDVETFKKRVLELSGPYVSFVDVRQAVGIVRDAAQRILPAVWAFLAAVGLLSVSVAAAALSSLRSFRLSRERSYRAIGATESFLARQAFHTLVFYVFSAFLVASVFAFPAAWGGIASVSFLKFSFPAALSAVGVLFAFLVAASASVALFERR